MGSIMALAVRVIVLHLFLMSFLVVQQKIGCDAQESLIELQKQKLKKCGIDRIYQFGDSLSDTGNCLRESYCEAHTKTGGFPFGMNFFLNATGRCSNGMLIIDFIALDCGLPLLNPSKDETANFSHGANFAVSGATALSVESLTKKKVAMSYTNSSLSVQLHWMDAHFKSVCSTDCPKYLEKSLFMLGEIGGNDFIYAVRSGKTIDELRRMIPEVVDKIIHGVRMVISFGATRIVVPGNFPEGCFPQVLTLYVNDLSTAYDERHCVIEWNNLVMSYNNYLQQAIHELRREYPNISIIYGDLYNAYLWLQKNAVAFGFDKNNMQIACCGTGGGGAYNFNVEMTCGHSESTVCADPSTYIDWDGFHLTEKGYYWVTKWLIHDILPQLNCHLVLE